MYRAIALNANLKYCDIKILLKSHFMRKDLSKGNPLPQKIGKNHVYFLFSYEKNCVKLCAIALYM
jgi:hypothetical protein